MYNVIILTIIYSVIMALSIALTGTRQLISGNLFNVTNFFRLIFDWRFIVAMLLAVATRFLFVFINSALLKLPHLEKNSTTITAFITVTGYIAVMVANFIILKERLTFQQFMGAAVIIVGAGIMLSK